MGMHPPHLLARLASVFVAAAGLLLAAPALAANNMGLETIPLTINNNTGSGKNIQVSITGMIGNTWYTVTDKQGNVARSTYSAAPKSFAVNIGKATKVSMKLPQLVGMRIYVSVDKPLKVNTSRDGVPGAPAGWVPNDPNFNTIFDWAEFTWVKDGLSTLGGNLTQVDMVGLAMRIDLTGLDSDLKTVVTKKAGFAVAAKTTARQTFFNTLLKAGAPWNALVMRDSARKPIRVISPYHGMEMGWFPRSQLQSYINQVYQRYATKTLSGTTEGVTFTGKTVGTTLVFTQPKTGASFRFPKPDSFKAYTGNFVPTPLPSDPVLERRGRAIGALLQGAFMRSTLLANTNLNACKKAQFYKNAPVNVYASTLHTLAIGGKAYAFGYDDTCEQSSYIGVHKPRSLVLTLGPL
ncbi:beta-1,3-glucanase family protein [Xanthobacter sediminis]